MSAEEIRRLAEQIRGKELEKESQLEAKALSQKKIAEALKQSEQRCRAAFELIAVDFSSKVGDIVSLRATGLDLGDGLFAMVIDFQSDLSRISAAISEKNEVHGSWNSSSHGDDFDETGRTTETLSFAIVDGNPSVLKCRYYCQNAWRVAWKAKPETRTTYTVESHFKDREALLVALYDHVARGMRG